MPLAILFVKVSIIGYSKTKQRSVAMCWHTDSLLLNCEFRDNKDYKLFGCRLVINIFKHKFT